MKHSIPKEIAIDFFNGTNYDYHFIKKQPAEESEGQFTNLGENNEKCITFSIPIEKEFIRIEKNGK